MEDNPAGGENGRDVEVAPALISVHPFHKSVAVAVGSDLRVFDLQEDRSVSLVDNSGGPIHKDSIRAICFGAEGKLLVSAGDDKLVKIWSTDSWDCIRTVCSEKRVSAATISNDGLFVCFADKFGVVWVVDVDGLDEDKANGGATPILAHYCSIITCLVFSPNGRFLVSADRDFKIRVTIFPNKPRDGAHEIQCFCLGHTEYISSLAFICSMNHPESFLVSGGGDSSVCLWDPVSGYLLDTCNVGAEVGLLESSGKADEGSPAVMDLCTLTDGTIVAVAIQSFQGIMLLNCELSSKTVFVIKVIHFPGEAFIPTSLGFSPCSEFLWMVMGVSILHGTDSRSLARVRVVSGFTNSSPELNPYLLGDDEIPGGGELLEMVQGSLSIEGKVLVEAAEAVRVAMQNLLTKKLYGLETRELRKRGRNDRKNKG